MIFCRILHNIQRKYQASLIILFYDKKHNQRRRFDAEAPGVAAGDDGWELVTSCA